MQNVGGEISSGQSQRRCDQERSSKSILRSAASLRTVVEQQGQKTKEKQTVQRRTLRVTQRNLFLVYHKKKKQKKNHKSLLT